MLRKGPSLAALMCRILLAYAVCINLLIANTLWQTRRSVARQMRHVHVPVSLPAEYARLVDAVHAS